MPMFEGLNAIPWAELSQAYGSAEEVPVWLRQLTSDDEQVRQQAMGKLGSSIYHQGSLYPATAYAVPYLIALLQERHRPARRLLTTGLRVCLQPLLQQTQGGGVQPARPTSMHGFRQPYSSFLLPGGSPLVDARQTPVQDGGYLLGGSSANN
jgi:hypothetical protein